MKQVKRQGVKVFNYGKKKKGGGGCLELLSVALLRKAPLYLVSFTIVC